MKKMIMIAALPLFFAAAPSLAQDAAAPVVDAVKAAAEMVKTSPPSAATGKLVFFRKGGIFGAAISAPCLKTA